MPQAPTGTCVYSTQNNVTVTLSLSELYRLINPDSSPMEAQKQVELLAECHNLIEQCGGMAAIAALGQSPVIRPAMLYDSLMSHQRRLASSGGICNMMTATMINRVFQGLDLESPFLTDTERDEIMRRQKDYQKTLFQKGLEPSPNLTKLERKSTNAVLKSSQFVFKFKMRSCGAFSPGQFPAQTVTDLLTYDRYLKLAIRMPAGSHALSVIRQGNYYIFDPNYGLYKYPSVQAFTTDLLSHITGYGATSYEIHAAEILPLPTV